MKVYLTSKLGSRTMVTPMTCGVFDCQLGCGLSCSARCADGCRTVCSTNCTSKVG